MNALSRFKRSGTRLLVAGRWLLLGAGLIGLVACDDDDPVQPRIQPPQLLATTEPQNVVENIAILYNDRVRDVALWVEEYEKLLLPPGQDPADPGFIFRVQPSDVGTDPRGSGNPIPAYWGIEDEVTAHRGLFQALADSLIYSLQVQITQEAPEDLTPPQQGRDGWKKIFASSVFLRLMFNQNDGLEVNGGQAEFLLKPEDGRWLVGEWRDLPRPFAPGQRLLVEPATWGRFKSAYHEGPYNPPPVPTPLLAPTRPEYLIRNIETLYNDRVRKAEERARAYADLLLSPGFVFTFQPADVGTVPCGADPIPRSWGVDDEIAAHEGLFAAQDAGVIFSLAVEVQHSPAVDIDPLEPGREGWKRIFASNVSLRLLYNPNDGLEVNGGQAEFDFAPAGDRWTIGEWRDLPRPAVSGQPAAVEPYTWGALKGCFK